MKELEKVLAQARRIEEHRTAEAERNIRKVYKQVLNSLREFIGVEYATLAEDDMLTYEILQKNNAYARFLDEIEQRINGISPEVSAEIRQLTEKMYSLAYTGMVEAVEKAVDTESLAENLEGLKAVSPEVIKKAVENPVSGLTLSDTLEKHRKEIIYDIKRNIGVGLANGDRMSTMAKRIKESIDGDYKKAIRIARTEAHRVREAGHGEAAVAINESLKEGVSGMVMMKTWRSMKDSRVRKTSKANHRKLNGVQIPVDEEFDLGRGVKAKEPGNSGDAANDIHCRCYLSYDLVEVKKAVSEGLRESVKITQGDDILLSWRRDSEKYGFEIDDAIANQGFDGLGKIVSSDDFDKIVAKNDMPILYRTFSANSEEALNMYDDMLLNGDWYVDCSTGGAQYGQGMYCAGVYGKTQAEIDGALAEMGHYIDLNKGRGNELFMIRRMTLDDSAKIVTYDDLNAEFYEHRKNAPMLSIKKRLKDASEELRKKGFEESAIDGILKIVEHSASQGFYKPDTTFEELMEIYETLTPEQAKAQNKLLAQIREDMQKDVMEAETMNIGSFAALKGYDAINAEGHGESGSYTVILNRTKVIFDIGDVKL